MLNFKFNSLCLITSISSITIGITALSAEAVSLSLAGQYTGQINGVPILATANGQMDTTGDSLNHTEITFQSIPSNFNPFFAGNSWNSSYHAAGVIPWNGGLNLFDLSGGNYLASRSVRWDSLPGEQITFIANVSTADGIMTANQLVNGTYSGPTDLIGVTNYQMLWTQLNPTSIKMTATATILRANGQSFGAKIDTVYSGLSAQMPTKQQEGTLTFSNQSFSNNIMSFDWQGMICPVPEPSSTLSLLALGTLGAASTLKRKLKPSQPSEKETTKVS